MTFSLASSEQEQGETFHSQREAKPRLRSKSIPFLLEMNCARISLIEIKDH